MSKSFEKPPEYRGRAVRGRGVRRNQAGRYERFETVEVDDDWPGERCDLATLKTEVRVERPRQAITRNTSPDVPFDRSLNPYRGCEHGCVYCFARPGHAWLGLSPGLDFETQLIARPQMPEVLKAELSKPGYVPAVMAIGTYTDAYQPVEKTYEIMRGVLQVLQQFHHPVAIVTKGGLVERDVDILADMAAMGLVRVGVSVTTLDRELARRMEPRVPPPARRLQTVARLAEAGIPVRIMASPMIPGLTDHELEAILKAGQEAGATAASWIMLRLPQEVSALFQEWLKETYPDRFTRVMAKLREAHGGREYRADWGRRMRGEGAYARLMARRFDVALRRLGLKPELPELRTDLFRVPERRGDQMSLF